MEHISEILKRALRRNPLQLEHPSSGPVSESSCPVCGGIEWVYLNVSMEHPDFGKPVPCRCIPTMPGQRYLELYWPKFAKAQCEDFGAAKQQMLREIILTERSLYLWGLNGHGKTHFLCALFRELCKESHDVILWGAMELIDKIKEQMAWEYQEILERCFTVKHLCIDDLGRGYLTAYVGDRLLRIVEERYHRNLPTYVTTNFSPPELAEHLNKGDNVDGNAIVSRLTDKRICRVVEYLDHDWRA